MEVTQRRPVGGSLGRLSSTRRGILTIAAVSALIAGGIIVYALSHYRTNANSSNQPATVLVATRFIAQGTAGGAIGAGELAKGTNVLEKQLSPGALADPGLLHEEVATRNIFPGQQLTTADFAKTGAFHSRLPRGDRAISVPVDGSHGMVGYLHSGNRVDVYVSFPGSGSTNKVPYLRLLATNVVVLDAAQAASGGIGNTNTANVVLQLDSRLAADLAFASDNGKIWLILGPGYGARPSREIITEQAIIAETQRAATGGAK